MALAAALGQTGRTPSLDALRAVDGKSLLASAATVYAGHYFDPVVDGVTVTEPLSESVTNGRLAPIPLLIGTNADEWRMYLEQPLDEAGWLRENAPGRETAVRAALASDQDAVRRMDRLETAHNFTCNSLRLADAAAQGGQSAWVYYFSRVREGIGGERLRAYHGAEIPYVFGTHDAWLPTNATDLALSGAMIGYWSRFARTGDPNSESAPRWPQWSADRPQAMALGNTVGAAAHPELSLCTALMPDSGPR
jgi:para-nitrobenzyl esterase